MYIERRILSGQRKERSIDESDDEEEAGGNYTVWVISQEVNVVTPYTYDEAISLAGQGSYTTGLLAVCSLSLLAMSVDFYSFPTIVTNSSCELEIGPRERSILLASPFLGAISTAYFWGYLSDTRGRRFSLLLSMWGSFIATTLSAFSPHWTVLAFLKFVSVSFCSCAQSSAFIMIAECCPQYVKKAYLLILTYGYHLSLPFYTVLNYVSLKMVFAYDIGFFTFTPWRMLVLWLGLPLGVCAVCIQYFYESPRFLANTGEKAQALENLRGIWKRNRCFGKKYSVEKLVLDEESNAASRCMPLLQSMWEQTAPIFRGPLLWRTLQLYFLTSVIYISVNSILAWFPFLVNTFMVDLPPHEYVRLCTIIENLHNMTNTNSIARHSCVVPKPEITLVWASVAQCLSLSCVTIAASRVSNVKVLVVVLLSVMSASFAFCVVIQNSIISVLLLFVMSLGSLAGGIVISYLVELFPTSYRGMASCLSIAVAGGSGLLGSASGLFITLHCSITFYVIAGYLICGALVACFLPSDCIKKPSQAS